VLKDGKGLVPGKKGRNQAYAQGEGRKGRQ